MVKELQQMRGWRNIQVKAAETSNSGAISNASNSHFMELGMKIFYTTQENAMYFLIVHYMAKSCAKLIFQEDSQVLTDVTIWFCQVVLTSHWPSPDSVRAEWVSTLFMVMIPAQFLAYRRPSITVLLGWLGSAAIEESEAVGRELRGSSHHLHPLPPSQHDITPSPLTSTSTGDGKCNVLLASS